MFDWDISPFFPQLSLTLDAEEEPIPIEFDILPRNYRWISVDFDYESIYARLDRKIKLPIKLTTEPRERKPKKASPPKPKKTYDHQRSLRQISAEAYYNLCPYESPDAKRALPPLPELPFIPLASMGTQFIIGTTKYALQPMELMDTIINNLGRIGGNRIAYNKIALPAPCFFGVITFYKSSQDNMMWVEKKRRVNPYGVLCRPEFSGRQSG